jgi:hypothetical protein
MGRKISLLRSLNRYRVAGIRLLFLRDFLYRARALEKLNVFVCQVFNFSGVIESTCNSL